MIVRVRPAARARRQISCRPPRRRSVAAVLLAMVGAYGVPAAAQTRLERAVEAAYLTKFAPFVTWPHGAGRDSDFSLCVVGSDPFGDLIDKLAAGQRVGGRALVVRRMASLDRAAGCKIAFLGGSRDQSVAAAIDAVQGAPVLTVTEGAPARGIIDFVRLGGRVRFRIDDAAAARNGLTLSSKLLTLAASVIPRGLRP